jgi:hypothetical protein
VSVGTLSAQDSGLILAWIAIILLAFACAGLLRQLRVLQSTQSGGYAPQSLGPTPGEAITPAVAARNEWDLANLLLFVRADCQPCSEVLQLMDQQLGEADETAGVALFASEVNGFHGQTIEAVAHRHEAFEELAIPVTPFLVVVDRSGKVVATAPVSPSDDFARIVGEARTMAITERR